MRSYGTSKSGYAKVGKTRDQTGKKKERKERYSTEWDVRIDCDPVYCDEIVNNLKNGSAFIEYCLVSGLEQPDEAKYGAKDIHTHLAIVLKYGMRRDQVLALCRGPLKKTDEYCVPRNRKFTYAGWYMHHTKLDWKLVIEKPIRYEYGILPDDELTEENKKKIALMFKKFSCDDKTNQDLIRIKFAKYLD